MQITITSANANNIVCNVTPPAQQVITIDRGVAGNGIVSIVPVTIATFQYLRITYTDGTVSDVGPLTSTAYVATAPIDITGNTISLLTVPIANGGTGQTTANAAFNALVPSQTGNNGKYLTTDGTNTSWATNPLGTVTSVSGTGTVSGLTLTGTVTTSGSLTLGGTLDLSAYNGAGAFTTLSASSSVTLSGGTANGVAYLNGSKVLTTGSNFVVDGTNVGIGTNSPQNQLHVNGGGITIGSGVNGTASQLIINTGTDGFNSPNIFGRGNGLNEWFVGSLRAVTGSGALGMVDFVYGANPRVFYTNSAERMRIDSSGNVGIGTSSPSNRLSVKQSADNSAAGLGAKIERNANDSVLFLGYRDNSDSWQMNATYTSTGAFKPLTFHTADAERMRLDTSGNVGIGRTPTAKKLEVAGQIWSQDATQPTIYFGDTLSDYAYAAYQVSSKIAEFGADGASTQLVLKTVATERMRINSIGHVGIGGVINATGLPNGTVLTVTGTNGTNPANISGIIELVNNQTAAAGNRLGEQRFVSGNTNGAAFAAYLEGSGGANGFGANLRFFTKPDNTASNPERMRIDSSGNVGIGTSSPGAKLDVNGAIQVQSTNAVQFFNANYFVRASTGLELQSADFIRFLTNGANERIRVDSSGNVGIGTNSPGVKLDVNGALRVGVASNPTTIANNSQFYDQAGIGPTISGLNFTVRTGSSTPSETFRIDSSGNVLVGGSSAAGKVTSYANFGNSFATNFGAHALGTAQGQLVGYTFYPTFQGTSDNAPRRAADIWSGFNAGAWGNEFLAFGVGTGAANDAGNATTERMRIDGSGNLGLGVTPSAWSSVGSALELKGNAYIASTSQVLSLATNAFYNGSNWIYKSSSYANLYETVFGQHRWSTAPSGTAGNAISFTQAMSLLADGSLVVGATSSIGAGPSILSKNTTAGQQTYTAWNASTSGNPYFMEFGTEGTYTARGSITYNRTAGLTAYNTTSDYRAKDIVGQITDSGNVIDSVPVYIGKMKGATQERPMFIAHETPPYAHTGEKDAVDADGNPVYQQMDASALVPVLWAELQSVRKRLAALEAK